MRTLFVQRTPLDCPDGVDGGDEMKTGSGRSFVASGAISWHMIAHFLIMVLVMLALLFLSAGRVAWWEGWAYAGMTLSVFVVSRVIVLLSNPDLAVERSEASQKQDVKAWDKILVPLISIYVPLASLVIAGFDERLGWTPDLPNYIQIIALGIMFGGNMVGTWAMAVNRFFSSHVRIQADRGHTVVSAGPYRIVRHPGYAGSVLAWIAAPVFFSSYWLAIASLVVIALNMIRTALEDRTLQAELPGYREYAERVRYRLIPWVW